MKLFSLIFSVVFIALFIRTANAAQSEYLHQQYLSVRAMGMGGTYTAVADDYNTLYLNPAGLGRLPQGQLNMGITGVLTPPVLSFYKDLSSAGSDPIALQNALANNYGSHYATRVGLGGTWVRPGWGIGFNPVDMTLEADIHGTAGTTVGVQAYQDTTLQFGYAWSWPKEEPKEDERRIIEEPKPTEEPKKDEKTAEDLAAATSADPAAAAEEAKKKEELARAEKEKKDAEEAKKLEEARKKEEELKAKATHKVQEKTFSIGVAPKAVYRAYFEKDLTIFDLQQSSSLIRLSDAQEGLAFDFDVGMLYTLKVPESGWLGWTKYAKPTFGFAVRNVIDGGFKSNLHLFGKGTSNMTGSTLERRFDAGTKFDLPSFWVFYPRAMVDFRDMGTRYASFKKSFHLGFELLWKAFSWLNGAYRLGVSQGYFTAGISAELGIFNLDLATYSEEIGTTSSPRENRRYALKASLDF